MTQNKSELSKTARLIATFFGSGLSPKAPGTIGTIATIPLVYALSFLGPYFYMAFTVLLFPIGLWAAEMYEQATSKHDSKEIVIDEVLGFLITMTWLPMTWQSMLFGFVLFRVLDILKPFPIGSIDKKVQGGLGVIADDVVAGLIANIALQVVYSQTNWLGAQLTTL
jgi:phosphatidylglycerophosphatase A